MKQLYYVHTEFDDYKLVIKANNADEAENLANDWFCDNISLLGGKLDVEWIVELCDNDEIIE